MKMWTEGKATLEDGREGRTVERNVYSTAGYADRNAVNTACCQVEQRPRSPWVGRELLRLTKTDLLPSISGNDNYCTSSI